MKLQISMLDTEFAVLEKSLFLQNIKFYVEQSTTATTTCSTLSTLFHTRNNNNSEGLGLEGFGCPPCLPPNLLPPQQQQQQQHQHARTYLLFLTLTCNLQEDLAKTQSLSIANPPPCFFNSFSFHSH